MPEASSCRDLFLKKKKKSWTACLGASAAERNFAAELLSVSLSFITPADFMPEQQQRTEQVEESTWTHARLAD